MNRFIAPNNIPTGTGLSIFDPDGIELESGIKSGERVAYSGVDTCNWRGGAGFRRVVTPKMDCWPSLKSSTSSKFS